MSLLSVNFNESHCPLSYLNAFDSSFTEVLLHLNVNLHISSITATEPKRFKYKYKARGSQHSKTHFLAQKVLWLSMWHN